MQSVSQLMASAYLEHCIRMLHQQHNDTELLSFWTLSIVWHSENIRQHSVSKTGPVSILM
jgi:hypothetical protein